VPCASCAGNRNRFFCSVAAHLTHVLRGIVRECLVVPDAALPSCMLRGASYKTAGSPILCLSRAIYELLLLVVMAPHFVLSGASTAASSPFAAALDAMATTPATDLAPPMPTYFSPELPSPGPDIQIRSTIIFGVFGTLLATVGIIVTGWTLRLARRTNENAGGPGSGSVGTEYGMSPIDSDSGVDGQNGQSSDIDRDEVVPEA